jgi:hypothetical protein
VFSHGRVTVYEGKHGPGDYRVEFNNAAPTHAELLAMMAWVFRAENRYTRGLGRRMLWMLLKEGVYKNGMPLEDVLAKAGGDRN